MMIFYFLSIYCEECDEEAEHRGEPQQWGKPSKFCGISDGMYCKRTNGRDYSNLSGAVTIMSPLTCKVMHFDVANRFCMKCESTSLKNNKDFAGQAPAMEAFLMTRMLKNSVDMFNVIFDT